MRAISTYLIVLSALLIMFGACDRTTKDDEPSAANAAESSEQAAESPDERPEEEEPSESDVATGSATPQTNIRLEQVATSAGYQRIDDLPEESLPTIPADAQQTSGIYESSDSRAGLILVRYPREGFARPHVEDIVRRAGEEPIAGATHGTEVLEVRAANASTAKTVADSFAHELNWALLLAPNDEDDNERVEAE